MDNIVSFPKSHYRRTEHGNAAAAARRAIEERLGVSFSDFMGIGGQRTQEVQMKIDRSLQKETLKMASQLR